MDDDKRNRITLEALAAILGGTFLFNLAILIVWFCFILFVPDWLYRVNNNWFAISRHEFDVINYCGIAFLKLINIALFLCPYLSIKLLLRKKKLDN